MEGKDIGTLLATSGIIIVSALVGLMIVQFLARRALRVVNAMKHLAKRAGSN